MGHAIAKDRPESPDDPLLALLVPALDRDPTALRRLVDGVAPDVVRVVELVLGPRGATDVDDVSQEALLRFVRALGAFRRQSTLRRYARRIAARAAADHLRRSARKASHHERFLAQGVAEQSLSPHERDARDCLRDLLRELPEMQAQTLVLRIVLGCSIGEIARATEAPANTVRSRLRLAKERLRRRIEHDVRLAELFGVVGLEEVPA